MWSTFVLAVSGSLCLVSGKDVFEDPDRFDIARCRAACMDDPLVVTESMKNCKEKVVCSTCWNTCELFSGNLEAWKPLCSQELTWLNGAQKPCNFFYNISTVLAKEKNSGQDFAFPDSLTWSSDKKLVQWDAPEPERELLETQSKMAVVYLIAQQDQPHQPWREILQTIDKFAAFDSSISKTVQTKMKLFAVTSEGILARKRLEQQVPDQTVDWSDHNQLRKDPSSNFRSDFFWMSHISALRLQLNQLQEDKIKSGSHSLPISTGSQRNHRCSDGPETLALLIVGGAFFLAMCAWTVCLWKISKRKTRKSENKAGILPVVERKPSLCLQLSQEKITSGPHKTLAKKLSRKLSNLELQYSPLSPFKQNQKDKGQPLLVEDPALSDDTVFKFDERK